ncbi:MAG: hypothetical protein ABI946_07645, partial [Chthoniobacterales bacterium]
MNPPKRSFNFPAATLSRQAGRLKDALNDGTVGPPVLARLSANFLTDFTALATKVSDTPAVRASQKGNTGTMTIEQNAAYLEMLRLMSAARRSAGLAFPGNDVVLHEEFKVGEHTPRPSKPKSSAPPSSPPPPKNTKPNSANTAGSN